MSTETGGGRSDPPPIPKHVLAMETALKLIGATCQAVIDAPASQNDLRPLGAALEHATVSVLDAYDLRREPIGAVRDAMQACDDAIALVDKARLNDEGLEGLTAWLKAARDWLHVPEQVHARTRAVPSPAREIVASNDRPELHRIDRPTVAPILKIATPLPTTASTPSLADELASLPPAERMQALKERGKQLREDAAKRRDARERERDAARAAKLAREDAPPRPGFTKGPHACLDVAQFVANRGRELFEDVAAMGMQRTPLLGDYWRGAEVFDKRMFRDLDGFAALGKDALSGLERFIHDAPSKDPARAFAIAMVYGCFEGRDGLAAAERALRFMGAGDPEVVASMSMALKLVPHPDLTTVLRRWLVDEEPGVRAIAIDVLAHRQLATPDELAAACRDESDVVAAAAFVHAALANIPDLGVVIEERSVVKSPVLIEAMAWASVLGGIQYAVDRLKKRFAAEGADAVLLPISLSAEQEDAQFLVERFQAKPSRALAVALGYAGSPASIPILVDALDGEGAPELKRDVAFALQRITGAELYDDVEIPPDAIDVEDPASPPLPDDAPPLTRMSSDRRDRPSEGAPDVLRMPTQRPEAWRAFLEAEAVRFQGDRRLRRGNPYTPAMSLIEIDTYQITPAERRILYREIVLKTGQVVPFDPVDFVVVQDEALKKLAPIVEKASSVPGAWGRTVRR